MTSFKNGGMDPLTSEACHPSPVRQFDDVAEQKRTDTVPSLALEEENRTTLETHLSAKYTPATKAYKNEEFLASREARLIRIMCEYQQPAKTFKDHGIENTMLLFASARGKSREQFDASFRSMTETLASLEDEKARTAMESDLERLKRTEWMCAYYDIVCDTARMLAQWGVDRKKQGSSEYSICTGGGPGLMEAANKGASSVEGAKSLGLGISLPFEAGCNLFVTPELAFEFHYFFTRKFWMTLPCKALIVAPGGFGTCDELFEFICLQQTGKKDWTPIVLLGSEYWNEIINWDAMAKYGTVSERDVKRLVFLDTAQEVYDYLTTELIRMESERGADEC